MNSNQQTVNKLHNPQIGWGGVKYKGTAILKFSGSLLLYWC